MATTRVVTVTAPSIFSSQFWTRSTIYDRHEARRSRTLQLRGDQRPTVVRVLAGLPGFRTVIPQYVPAGPIGTAATAAASSSSPATAAAAVAVSSGDSYYLSSTTVSFHKNSITDDTAMSPTNAVTLSGLAAVGTAALAWKKAATASAQRASTQRTFMPGGGRAVCYQTLLLQQGRRAVETPSALPTIIIPRTGVRASGVAARLLLLVALPIVAAVTASSSYPVTVAQQQQGRRALGLAAPAPPDGTTSSSTTTSSSAGSANPQC